LRAWIEASHLTSAAGFWIRANTYFASCGITVQRVLTDNGACYRSLAFAAALGESITTVATPHSAAPHQLRPIEHGTRRRVPESV